MVPSSSATSLRISPSPRPFAVAKTVLGWPKGCKLAHASLWRYSYERLKLAQLLGQLGVFLTRGRRGHSSDPAADRYNIWAVLYRKFGNLQTGLCTALQEIGKLAKHKRTLHKTIGAREHDFTADGRRTLRRQHLVLALLLRKLSAPRHRSVGFLPKVYAARHHSILGYV